jgi:hypothetical protein
MSVPSDHELKDY